MTEDWAGDADPVLDHPDVVALDPVVRRGYLSMLRACHGRAWPWLTMAMVERLWRDGGADIHATILGLSALQDTGLVIRDVDFGYWAVTPDIRDGAQVFAPGG